TIADLAGETATASVTILVYPTPSAFTWSGAGNDDRWDNPDNWFGGSVPLGMDEALFSGYCGFACTATIDSDISVAGIDLDSSFAGTLIQEGASEIGISTIGYKQSSGLFEG